MVDYTRIREDIERSGLAPATKRSYQSKLRAFEVAASFPKDVKRAVAEVNRSGKASSEGSYLTFLLGVSRISKEMKEVIGKQARALMQRVDVLATQSGDQKRERHAREGDVQWEEIMECGERFTEPEEQLIFALYTQLPPQRADFNAVEIVPSRARATNEGVNYYAKKEGDFIFRAYKSARRYGEKVIRAPPKLRKMLAALPKGQKYVLQGYDGEPLSPNTLSQKVKRAFARACQMHVTINTLRRSWAAKSMRGSPTDEQVAEYASQLDHSIATHRSYAFLEQ